MQNAVIALLLAFSGINYEFLISQNLTAIFGGTFFQYIVIFSLFTFSLGGGSLFFQKLKPHWLQRRFLGFVQMAMTIYVLFLPLYFGWIDGLSFDGGSQGILLGLAYSPAILVGFITGLEIPFLMGLEKKNPIRVLAFDFIGMFLGTVLFPTVLLYRLGLNESTYLCAGLNCLVGFWLIFGGETKAPTREEVETLAEKAQNSVSFMNSYSWMALVLSFCSFSYETLVTKIILSIVGDGLFDQVICLGIFILGLGVGALFVESFIKKKAHSVLIYFETIIAILACVIPMLTFGIAIAAEAFYREFFTYWIEVRGFPILTLLMVVLPLLMGFLTGAELPLLFLHLNLKGSEPMAIRLLSFNYFGALLGGIVSVLVLLPVFGSQTSVIIVALINIVALYFLLLDPVVTNRLQKMLLPFGALLVALGAISGQASIQRAYLKVHYGFLGLPDLSVVSIKNFLAVLDQSEKIVRLESKYQNIDLVMGSESRLPLASKQFSLFLNGHPQFSSDGWQVYHESFVWGAINLAGRMPRRVLVLGGGDGLLVKKLLDVPDIHQIDLVEIDPVMIRLANNYSPFIQLNELSLIHPKVKVVTTDAFLYVKTYLAKSSELYDGIFIDFPYPNSYDLSRLYSVEFYRNVSKILAPKGFVILDAPLSKNLDADDESDAQRHRILLNTLVTSGFVNLMPFGPFDPFLFAMKDPQHKLEFNYDRLPSFLSHRAFANLKDIKHIVNVDEARSGLVNSIYYPKWLR